MRAWKLKVSPAGARRRVAPRTGQSKWAPERQCHERRFALGQERAGESHNRCL